MHQMSQTPVLTTSNGNPIDDNQNSLTAGQYGPVLIQDFALIDKLGRRRTRPVVILLSKTKNQLNLIESVSQSVLSTPRALARMGILK